MFGAFAFGQFRFGGTVTAKITTLFAASTYTFGTSVALTTTATFTATSTISYSTAGALNTLSHFDAATTYTFGSDARLSGATTLFAASSYAWATTANRLLMYADFRATSTYTITAGPITLAVGAVHLEAVSTYAWSTVPPFVSRLPQFFAASSTITFGSSFANIVITGYGPTSCGFMFNGVPYNGGHIRMGSLSILDQVNEGINTADWIMDVEPPGIGTDVKIGLGNFNPDHLLFAGTVQRGEKYYQGRTTHPVWRVSAMDYSLLLNRRLVTATYTNVSATTAALDILARFTSGFSSAAIVAGLPAITITFDGVTVMQALTQLASLVGGYAYVDYQKVVHLYISESTVPPIPNVIDGTDPLQQFDPPITFAADEAQVRTRVLVKGASATVGGAPDFAIPAGTNLIPVDDASIFSSGQAITDDAQILGYTGMHPGGVRSTITGNVAGPTSAPVPAVAAGVSGGLQGTYRWQVSFENAGGETAPGPMSVPLTVPGVTAPAAPLGIGAVGNTVGPLVGTYRYACSFVTAQGETVPGPVAQITDVTVAAPPSLTVTDGTAAGPLVPGALYRYALTYITTYGETLPTPLSYQPSALPVPGWTSGVTVPFGGMKTIGAYYYGITAVTAFGETAPPNTGFAFADQQTTGPSSYPYWTGNQDTNGRIQPGYNYAYGATFYSDQYGETPIGPQYVVNVGGSLPIRMVIALPSPLNLPDRADGVRIYRGITGYPMQINADFRRGNIPGTYWDALSQGECGNAWPVHTLRAGVGYQLTLPACATPGCIARRLYRTKAGGLEYFLTLEVQHNNTITILDTASDDNLTVRNPVVATTGRSAMLTVPTQPQVPAIAGIIGRRLYRTQANGSDYFLLAELENMTTASYLDTQPDNALTSATLPTVSTAGGASNTLQSIPIGPAGTIARRIYRTTAGGTELKLLTQLSDNTTTTLTDSTPDSDLGAASAPLTSSAGASAVNLTQIPLGPTGVTQRVIYRTKAGGNDFLYAGTLNDNTSTTFLDTQADSALGRTPFATSTIGANAGDTSVLLASTGGWPTSGWFSSDQQIIRYTGISGNSLTGIPPLLSASIYRTAGTATLTTTGAHGYSNDQRIMVMGADQPEYNGTQTIKVLNATQCTYPVTTSGPAGSIPASPATGPVKSSAAGAITAPIAGGTTVETVPMITGVSNLQVSVRPGTHLALWVVRDSPNGQANLAGAEGGDGVHEYLVTDGNLKSVTECAARGDAELLLFQFPQITITYATRDIKTRSGKTVHLALSALGLSGDYLIQTVRIDQIDIAPRTYPRFTVTASNTQFTLADLLAHVVLKR